jgi:hypothetical protein
MARRIDNKPRPHICKLVENTCKKTFILKRDLTRHQRRHFPTKTVYCKKCTYSSSRTDAVNIHIKRIHGGVSNGRVRKQSKQKPVNIKTIVLTFQNDPLTKQEMEISKTNTEDKNQNVVSLNCDEVCSLRENVEIIKNVNTKLKQELYLKDNLLEEQNRTIIKMKAAHTALNESFDIVSGCWSDCEEMLKNKTNELAMSLKTQLDLKNEMSEDRKSMEESMLMINQKIVFIKQELYKRILSENIFKPEAVRNIGTPIMSVSTEAFENYIHQIFIHLCDKYFDWLNDIV